MYQSHYKTEIFKLNIILSKEESTQDEEKQKKNTAQSVLDNNLSWTTLCVNKHKKRK